LDRQAILSDLIEEYGEDFIFGTACRLYAQERKLKNTSLDPDKVYDWTDGLVIGAKDDKGIKHLAPACHLAVADKVGRQ
jgi:hypothetical protein